MILAALLAAAGAFFGFANPLFQFPPAVILLPAALGFIGLNADSPSRAFRHGFLAGTLAYVCCLYWIVTPVHVYGGLSLALALPCPVLVSMYHGFFMGLFCLALNTAGRGLPGLVRALFAGVLWASFETLREWFLSGFPWVPLASGLVPWPELVQSARYVGGIGLSALVAALGVSLVPYGRRPLGTMLTGVAIIALLVTGGRMELGRDIPVAGQATVALIQGNIDQSVKWEPGNQNATLSRYFDLSTQAIRASSPDLVIWPETAMPFYFQDVNALSAEVKLFVRETGIPLVSGSPAYSYDVRTGAPILYNRAYLIGPEGRAVAGYDKQRLVPFGEYVPLKEYLPLGKLVEGVGDFAPGTDPSPLRTGNLALGMLICYETIFPGLAQERAAAGANLLVNISNDAWFGRSSAPLQHLQMSALRAVEQGRWLARATNTGISAFVDEHGRVHSPTALFEATSLSMRVPLIEARTVFGLWYGPIRYTIYTLAVLLAVLGYMRTAPNVRVRRSLSK